MRDIALTAVLAVLIPASFFRPWIGILLWAWLGYMNPHKLCWGFARNLIPFAQLTAIATFSGLFFTKDRRPFIWSRETVLMLALWFWFSLTTLFAWFPDDASLQWQEVSKILFMNFLSIPLIQDRNRMRWLLIVIAASLGFYGFKAGLFVIGTGGHYMVLGAPGRTYVSTNNTIALVLNMCLPIFWYLRKHETRTWARHLLLATFCLSIIAVPFTYSRGGVLGLVFVLAVLFSRSRRRFLALPIAALGLLSIFLLAPEKWVSRMQTIETYDQDRSAMGRLTAWKVGFKIAQNSPLVGGGFEVFNKPLAYQKYAPDFHHFIDAHSIYFNLLGEHGFVGLGLYLALLVCLYSSLRTLYRLGKSRTELAWIADYAHMLGCSILAYLFTGAFLSAAYLDLAWQLFALVVILRQLAQRELVALAAAPQDGSQAAARAAPKYVTWGSQGVPFPAAGRSVAGRIGLT